MQLESSLLAQATQKWSACEILWGTGLAMSLSATI